MIKVIKSFHLQKTLALGKAVVKDKETCENSHYWEQKKISEVFMRI